MAEFIPNKPVETTEPKVEVTVDPNNPFPVGRLRFRLVVTDDAGNESAPDEVDVIIRDSERPTAVLDAPRAVNFRESFALVGDRSTDVGGRIVTYRWELIEAPERPNGPIFDGPVITRPITPINPIVVNPNG
jgi:hypothetical protein